MNFACNKMWSPGEMTVKFTWNIREKRDIHLIFTFKNVFLLIFSKTCTIISWNICMLSLTGPHQNKLEKQHFSGHDGIWLHGRPKLYPLDHEFSWERCSWAWSRLVYAFKSFRLTNVLFSIRFDVFTRTLILYKIGLFSLLFRFNLFFLILIFGSLLQLLCGIQTKFISFRVVNNYCEINE